MLSLRSLLVFATLAAVAACVDASLVDRPKAKAALDGDAGRCRVSDLAPDDVAPNWQFIASTTDDVLSLETTRAHDVLRELAELGYDLDRVRDGDAVPRLVPAALPSDLTHVRSNEVRKSLFIAMVLPIGLHVNERVLMQRQVLEAIRNCESRGIRRDAETDTWIQRIADLYDADPDIDRLLARIDVIPLSLLLAQAAIESGWGTSRFAREGNALFGEYTYKADRGLLPRAIESGDRFRMRNFETAVWAVASYVRNLNTHPAYEGFRARRAEIRAAGRTPTGDALAGELTPYSIRRGVYVQEVLNIMQANRLDDFDGARLAGGSSQDAAR